MKEEQIHFSVLVIGDDIDSILDKYDENKDVEPYEDKSQSEIEGEFRDHQKRCFEKVFEGQELNEFDRKTLELNHVTPEWWQEWNDQDLNEDGNSLTTYNTDSQWDWYEVGGRWMGSLVLKKGRTGKLGTPGVFMNPPKHDADIATIGDVDWVAMRNIKKDECVTHWDFLFTTTDEQKLMHHESYESKKTELLEKYGSKKEYVRRMGIWTTYALVTDEDWFERDSSDPDGDEKYANQFVSVLKSLPKDTIITVVDCHI